MVGSRIDVPLGGIHRMKLKAILNNVAIQMGVWISMIARYIMKPCSFGMEYGMEYLLIIVHIPYVKFTRSI